MVAEQCFSIRALIPDAFPFIFVIGSFVIGWDVYVPMGDSCMCFKVWVKSSQVGRCLKAIFMWSYVKALHTCSTWIKFNSNCSKQKMISNSERHRRGLLAFLLKLSSSRSRRSCPLPYSRQFNPSLLFVSFSLTKSFHLSNICYKVLACLSPL